MAGAPDTQSTRAAPPAVLFFGMAGQFSRLALLALLEAGIAVRAVVMPSAARLAGLPLSAAAPPIVQRTSTGAAGQHGRALPLLGGGTAETIAQIAAARDIPLCEVSRLRDPQIVSALGAYAPDVICVACFPWRLPRELLDVPRLGCLNLHPSLLPDNRGPDPLFWTFRRGDAITGVTAHIMDERLDAGPIVLQRPVPVPEGIGEAELEHACAQIGGTVLAQAVWGLARRSIQPQPQDEARATSYPWPAESDYVVTPEQPAWLAHRFVSGVGGRGVPIRALVPGHIFCVVESLGCDRDATMASPWQVSGSVLAMRCSVGVWHALIRLGPHDAPIQ